MMETAALGGISATWSLCPPQMSHVLTRNRTHFSLRNARHLSEPRRSLRNKCSIALYVRLQLAPHSTHSVSALKICHWMTSTRIIFDCPQIHIKQKQTKRDKPNKHVSWGQIVEILNAESSGIW